MTTNTMTTDQRALFDAINNAIELHIESYDDDDQFDALLRAQHVLELITSNVRAQNESDEF